MYRHFGLYVFCPVTDIIAHTFAQLMGYMTTPSSTPYSLTGDNLIDAATNGYYWMLDGSRTINWALADGFLGEYWYSPTDVATALVTVFDSYSYYANVRFNYVGYYNNPSTAYYFGYNITVSLDSYYLSTWYGNSTWAVGFFPNTAYNIDPYLYQGAPGDIFLNINSQANYLSSYALGSAGYALAIHEIGHTLGLKHPFDNGGTGHPTLASLGAANLNKDWFTVMAYSDDYNYNLLAWDPATPMAMDVLALQYLYGPNLQTNAGNDTYTLPITNLYATIWDAAGTDAVDVSLSSVGWEIYLPEYQLSSLVTTKVGGAAPLNEVSLSSPYTMYWLMGDIENGSGSSLADVITGSSLANTLNGNGGNDTLDGGAGNDTLYGGTGDDTFDWNTSYRAGNDVFYGGAGNDVYVLDTANDSVIEYLGEGIDTIFVSFSFSLSNLTYVEELSAFGTNGVILTGNSYNNVIKGASGNDTLTCAGGNDVFAFAVNGNGLDTITDFSVGDCITVTGAAFAGTIVAGNGSALLANQVQLAAAGGTTTLYIGTDSTAGADVQIQLTGTFAASGFALYGNTIALNNTPMGLVAITGTATQGQTLTVANTLADIDGLGTIGYQWQADGANIIGATASTYVLAEAQVGKTITVSASYTDLHNTAESVISSATTAVVNVNDVPTGSVTINGTAAQNQTLTATNTLADIDGLGAIGYQWQANGSNITRATGS